ncbi:MAG: tetratricopeptide repeat protein [Phycisphaerae bacterium]|nr:tetratricopeptide repeat protein [Phycisphaerae bacterium]
MKTRTNTVGQGYRWIGSAPVFCITGILLACGCRPEPDHLMYRHMSQNQRAEAKQRWETVRSSVKLRLAEEHLEAGRIDDAEQVLENAISLASDNPRAYLLAARLRLEQGQLAKARQAIVSAASMSDGDPEIDYVRGIIAERYGDLETALEHYSSAVMQSPNVAAYVLAQAETLVALDKPADALALIEPRIIDFEGSAPMHMLAARIDRILGLRGPAVEHCHEALRGRGDDVVLCEEAGMLLAWAEQYADAIAVLQPLLDRSPSQACATGVSPVSSARGWRLHKASGTSCGDLPADGLATAPGAACTGAFAPAVVRALANAYLATGKASEARRVLKTIIVQDERDVVAWCLYARAALTLGELDAAAEAMETIHRHGTATAETWLLTAYVAFQRGDYLSAIEAAEAALRLDGCLVTAHCLVGQSAAAMGRRDQARRAYAMALTVDPNSQMTRALLEAVSPNRVLANESMSLDHPRHRPPARDVALGGGRRHSLGEGPKDGAGHASEAERRPELSLSASGEAFGEEP